MDENIPSIYIETYQRVSFQNLKVPRVRMYSKRPFFITLFHMKTSKNTKRRILEVAHPRVMQSSTESLPGP